MPTNNACIRHADSLTKLIVESNSAGADIGIEYNGGMVATVSIAIDPKGSSITVTEVGSKPLTINLDVKKLKTK